MATLTTPLTTTIPAGRIVATGITYDDYMAHYAEQFHEWVKGSIIRMSPVSGQHDDLTAYLRLLFDAYFSLNPVGRTRSAPFVMRIPDHDIAREPDVQVILHTNPGDLTDTAMIGAADICIEVVSPESATRDFGDKFIEYEKVGVRDYWVIDPLRHEAHFHRLQDSGLYARVQPDDAGHFHTPLLPRLTLHVPTLWTDPLPNAIETVAAVQTMLADDPA